MVYLYYIPCFWYTILAGNPQNWVSVLKRNLTFIIFEVDVCVWQAKEVIHNASVALEKGYCQRGCLKQANSEQIMQEAT